MRLWNAEELSRGAVVDTNYCLRFEESRIQKLVMFLFRDRMAAAPSMNRSRFLRLILEPNWAKTKTSFVNMTTPSVLAVAFVFYCLLVFDDG